MTVAQAISSSRAVGRLRFPERPLTDVRVLIVGALVLAWLNRFIQDDAFISFRYADNFVSGYGLRWNPGEAPVAGYSTFLWTVLIGGVIALGLDPVTGSWGLGLALFAGTLVTAWRLASDILGDRQEATFVVALLGTNYTFSSWATGGMETQLQAFLVTSSTYLVFHVVRGSEPHLARLVGVSVLFALALLTRLDSAVVVAVLGVCVLLRLWRQTPGRLVASVLALVVPGLCIVGGWLGWTVSYYGDPLPNTYYVKVATSTSAFGGLHYIYRFVTQYWYLPLGALLLAARPRTLLAAVWGAGDRRVTVLGVVVVAWGAYLVRTGGDFMEFRFLVPILPLMVVWLWHGARLSVPERRVRIAAIVVLIAASALHAATFRGGRFGLESIDGIASHMREEGGAWDEVGKSLGSHFGGADSDVTLAVGGAGAIPFYSKLRSVDMRGLNDRWVARHGHVVGSTPGHQRMAPLDYLVDQRVNLVVGHPQMSSPGTPLPEYLTVATLRNFGLVDATDANVPEGARFVVVPVSETLRVTVLYLQPNQRVDRAIAVHGLAVIPLRRHAA